MAKQKSKPHLSKVHDKIADQIKEKGHSGTLLGILASMSDKKLQEIYKWG